MMTFRSVMLVVGMGVCMCSPKNPPASGGGSEPKPSPPVSGPAAAKPPAPDAAPKPPSPSTPSAPATAATPAASAPPAAAPEAAEARWVEITAGSGRYLLAPVADSRGRPKDDRDGKREWMKASKGGKVEVSLIYVMVPNAHRTSTYRHATAKGEAALPAPRMIYRHPTSGLYTWFLLDAEDPGRLKVAGEGGAAGTVDLAPLAARLRALPPFLDEDGGIAFDDLPGWMERRISR